MSDDEYGSEETGFDPGQAADSMVSGIGDFFGSALDATENLGMAAVDTLSADGALITETIQHVEAGALRAVGEEELASNADYHADEAMADARRYSGDVNTDLGNAWDAIAGEDETLFK